MPKKNNSVTPAFSRHTWFKDASTLRKNSKNSSIIQLKDNFYKEKRNHKSLTPTVKWDSHPELTVNLLQIKLTNKANKESCVICHFQLMLQRWHWNVISSCPTVWLNIGMWTNYSKNLEVKKMYTLRQMLWILECEETNLEDLGGNWDVHSETNVNIGM